MEYFKKIIDNQRAANTKYFDCVLMNDSTLNHFSKLFNDEFYMCVFSMEKMTEDSCYLIDITFYSNNGTRETFRYIDEK